MYSGTVPMPLTTTTGILKYYFNRQQFIIISIINIIYYNIFIYQEVFILPQVNTAISLDSDLFNTQLQIPILNMYKL